MITAENLHKRYGSLKAVDGISLDVREGELFGFLGPNGAGKTTTLSMISGLLRPDEGTVTLNNIDVWQSPKEAKRFLGLVPQDVALYEELNAMENLKFWGGLYGLPKAELKKNIQEILERVGLADRIKEPIRKYSGGMKRRLNLAIGLVHKPKVILLDEPTVGIDPQARNNIMEVIRGIAREGNTIIFTTHHLEEAESLCERIAIMDHGKILATGTVDELAKVAGDEDIVTIRGGFTSQTFQSVFSSSEIHILKIEDNHARFSFKENHINIASLVQKLTEAQINIEDISVQKPSLESVFLKLTGRELRD